MPSKIHSSRADCKKIHVFKNEVLCKKTIRSQSALLQKQMANKNPVSGRDPAMLARDDKTKPRGVVERHTFITENLTLFEKIVQI